MLLREEYSCCTVLRRTCNLVLMFYLSWTSQPLSSSVCWACILNGRTLLRDNRTRPQGGPAAVVSTKMAGTAGAVSITVS